MTLVGSRCFISGAAFARAVGGSDVETQRRRLSIAHGRMERKKRRTARQEQADFERKMTKGGTSCQIRPIMHQHACRSVLLNDTI